MSALERRWYAPPPARWDPVSPLLYAGELMFRAGVALRELWFAPRWARMPKLPVPVISVGNLNVGGAGKTPVVIHLAQKLIERGRRVAVLSRGYGGSIVEGVVGDGERILLSAEQAGDEPVLIARRVPKALVLVGAQRTRTAQMAIERGADVILLDDGFQHRHLARHEDLVVLGGPAPLGNGRMLPVGPLREPVSALRRATVAWLTNGAEQSALPPELTARRIVARTQPVALTDLALASESSLEALRGAKVLLWAGLARPSGFARTLTDLGAQIAGEALFPDHHAYRADDLARVAEQARRLGAAFVCTTEKDAVRLEGLTWAGGPCAVVRLATEVLAGHAVLDELLSLRAT